MTTVSDITSPLQDGAMSFSAAAMNEVRQDALRLGIAYFPEQQRHLDMVLKSDASASDRAALQTELRRIRNRLERELSEQAG